MRPARRALRTALAVCAALLLSGAATPAQDRIALTTGTLTITHDAGTFTSFVSDGRF